MHFILLSSAKSVYLHRATDHSNRTDRLLGDHKSNFIKMPFSLNICFYCIFFFSLPLLLLIFFKLLKRINDITRQFVFRLIRPYYILVDRKILHGADNNKFISIISINPCTPLVSVVHGVDLKLPVSNNAYAKEIKVQRMAQ